MDEIRTKTNPAFADAVLFIGNDFDSTGVGGVIGVGGGVGTPRDATPRRRNGSAAGRRHRRRRSSSGSGAYAGIAEQALKGDGDAGEDERGRERSEGDGGELEGERPGLAVEVRISAPVISVLLVHDDRLSSSPLVFSASSLSAAFAPESAADHPGRTGITEGRTTTIATIVDADTDDGKKVEGSTADKGNERGRRMDGALVLVEIEGLGLYCRASPGRASIADGDGGGGGDCVEAAIGDGPVPTKPQYVLTATSFHVEDMHQQAGKEFACLLSSKQPLPSPRLHTEAVAGPPPEPDPVPLCASDYATASEAVRITHAIPRQGASRPSKTVVSLARVWANWNPETIAALSMFLYGMYGNWGTRGRGGDNHDKEAAGEEERVGERWLNVNTTTPKVGKGGVGQETEGTGRVGSPPVTSSDPAIATSRPGSKGLEVGVGSNGRSEKGEEAASVPPTSAGARSPLRRSARAPVARDSVNPAAATAPVGDGAGKVKRAGVVVVEIKRASLWLNKEFHGRRLLLLEVADSKVLVFSFSFSCIFFL